jgi:ribonuclease P protein component
MKKENRLSKNTDFQRIIESKKQFTSNTLVLYYEFKNQHSVKIGISVSKKLGNAVFRNRTRREIRRVLDKHLKLEMNYNLVLIVRKKFINLTSDNKEKEIAYILNKLNKKRR